MRLDRAGFALTLALGALFAPACACAEWGPDGTPVAAAADYQYSPVSASDGAGGAFVAWLDRRGSPTQIYAQRLSISGAPVWTLNGIPICLAPGSSQRTPAIVADGQGGAIVLWASNPISTDKIFAQRLDAAGNRLWGSNGMMVCPAGGYQLDPRLAPDGLAGALVVWRDQRNEFEGDLYAQRVSAAGAILWDSLGVPICLTPKEQLNPVAAACGAGSAIIAWENFQSGVVKVHAQLVNSSGVVQWTPNGVPVCPAPGNQTQPTVVDDGANGAVLAWVDRRSSPSAAMYAQRLSNAGTALWDTAGVALCDTIQNVAAPCALSDGAGGAIFAWQGLVGGQYYAYAQRMSGSGTALFDPLGLRLTSALGSEDGVRIASDGLGGAVVAWRDARLGTSNTDIYAQRVTPTGGLKWEAEGRAVCTATNVQNTPTIAPGPPGSAIIAWADFRGTTGYDVYAGRPDSISVLAVPWESPVTRHIGSLRPNPTRAGAALDFALTTSQRVSIVVFDVGGRVVRRIMNGQVFAAGTQTVAWDGTSDRGDPVPVGVYCVRVSGSDYAVTRRVAIVR